jgi:hypothetical protein
MPDSLSPEDASPETDPDAELPPNRAARRAKARGKGVKAPLPQGKGPVIRDQNRGGGPRQWSNRRGGGS